MLNRILNWLADWFLARVGEVRAQELRDQIKKESADAQKRMDDVKPVSRSSVSKRLRDGSA